MYQPDALEKLVIPDSRTKFGLGALEILRKCFRETRDIEVGPYRDGYSDVRRRWDTAVSVASGIDIAQLQEYGEKLAEEPTIRGNVDQRTVI